MTFRHCASHSQVEGFMGKFVSRAGLACVSLTITLLLGCSQSKTTNVVGNAIPTSISLTTSAAVGTNVSVEAGKTLALSAIARGAQNQTLPETFSFLSSNSAAVTIAVNGFLCAGTWDSLTLPQACTPGTVGTSQVTATAEGISSPPITIYVHQRIT